MRLEWLIPFSTWLYLMRWGMVYLAIAVGHYRSDLGTPGAISIVVLLALTWVILLHSENWVEELIGEAKHEHS